MKSGRPLLCLVMGLWLAGCSKENKSVPMHLYTSPRYGFSVTVAKDPEEVGAHYRFFSQDMTAILLEIQVTPVPVPYADQPPDRNLDVYERAYKSEPGAVVAVKSITLQGAPGRQFDITAGPHAPSRKRVYVANKTYYFLEFDPNIPGATELADTFQF
jgi:hypothetical protein